MFAASRFRNRTQLISVRQVDWSVMLINYSSLWIRTRLTECGTTVESFVSVEKGNSLCVFAWGCAKGGMGGGVVRVRGLAGLDGCLFALVDHLKVHWFRNVCKVWMTETEEEKWKPLAQGIQMFALAHKCKQIWIDVASIYIWIYAWWYFMWLRCETLLPPFSLTHQNIKVFLIILHSQYVNQCGINVTK